MRLAFEDAAVEAYYHSFAIFEKFIKYDFMSIKIFSYSR